MSKIICDICGTSYPETAKRCPICGCVRPGDVQRVTNEVKTNGKVSTGYTYVKGGRFSKTNVKKRTYAQTHSESKSETAAPKNDKNQEQKDNRGLVITAIVLLLAIIGVVIYIALRFFAPISGTDGKDNTTIGAVDLACKAITLDTETLVLEQEGEARLLNVTVEPKNTSDSISFRSENEAVVTVNSVGKITAVGEGSANIIITCGNITKQCMITVQYPEESTLPENTEDTSATENTTLPQETLSLNRKDITFGYKGEAWVLYSGEIAKNLITWTSDDETVATFTDGKVVAVGGGMTEVHAEFDGQKVTCIIRCSFQGSTGVVGNGGVSEDGGGSVQPDGGNAGATAVTGTVKVNEYLNVRAEPSINGTWLGTLKANEKVTILEQKTDANGTKWGRISTSQISSGWISLDYVALDVG